MKNRFTLIIFVIILILSSCKKNISPTWDINAEGPLLYTSLGISNIIPDSLLKTNPDNSLSIIYENSLYNFQIDS